MITAGVMIMDSGGRASAVVSPGQGSSAAQILQVAPHEGSLAVGAIMGESLAGHTANYARAQSQGIDLGAIGTSLKGYNCGSVTYPLANSVPTALEVETPANGGTAQQTIGAQQNYYMQDFGNPATSNPPPAPTYGWTEHGSANGVPYAEADTSLVQSLDEGAISVAGLASKAWSGLVDGQREAGATVDIGSITLGTGAASVSLQGLHWEAAYPSGSSAQPSGGFTLGKLLVGGVALPTNQSLSLLQTVVNTALGPLGVELQLPTVSVANGVINVTPLQLEQVPASAPDSLLQPLLNGLQPVTGPIFNGLENGFGTWEPAQVAQLLCQSDTPISVLDITLAALSGGGFTNISFGGVNASSAALPVNPYHFSLTPGFTVTPPRTEFLSGSAGSAGTPAIPGTPGTPGTATAVSPTGGGAPTSSAPTSSSSANPSTTAPTSQSAGQPISQASSSGFKAGGPLLGIGLGSLGLLALLAEGDRRMMRRAQRTIAFED